MIGTKLAHYEITGKLGEGGMGVVYRAIDTKLNREVAIKVLPDTLTGDPGRMERFHREAQLLAQLNHPNIAGIHGVEESEGLYALVMEIAEGETLAERLASGAFPVEEALPVAKQIAEALEAAHERGIIHRDLKPANIKISEDGQVKVLDFGLAKALEGDPTSSRESEHSPTLTIAATQAGVILGTAAYMSPEQARGRTADKRADIWSFGVVLYEMLTARQMFGGETVSDSLAGVLKTEIDLGAMPEDTPRPVRRLLQRCLQRDRRHRLQAIGDARIEIEEVLAGAEEPVNAAVSTTPSKSAWSVAGLAAAVVLIAGMAVGWVAWKSEPSLEIPLRKFTIASGVNARGSSISPDGRYVLYQTIRPGIWIKLWLKDLESDTVSQITELPWVYNNQDWSPNSDEIAYSVGSEVFKYSLAGGSTVKLCGFGANRTFGMSWSPDGELIVFSAAKGGPPRLYGVPAHGGTPEPLFESDTSDRSAMRHPHFIPYPDGRRVLLYEVGRDHQMTLRDLAEDGSVELGTGHQPIYSPTGHIIYELEESLWALPFSAESRSVTGEPFLISRQAENASVARDGTMVYTEITDSGPQQLVWKSRDGRTLGTIGQPQEIIRGPHLSPDGKRVVVHATENDNMDVWVHDTTRPIKSRITSDAARENRAIWSPDGRRIIYSSDRNGEYDVFVRNSNGRGEERALFGTEGNAWVMDWSPDGEYVFVTNNPDDRPKTFYVNDPLGSEASELTALLETGFAERAPNLSPDGRYVAYATDETGQEEVFVERFREPDDKIQVSLNGGTSPRWRADGKEIFYVSDSSLVAVPISLTPDFTVGEPAILFEHDNLAPESGQQYDVSPDGERIVIVEFVNREERATIRLVLNWFAEFRAGETEVSNGR
jgi:eukaryotic-like serine/threonine-protein kinase